MNSCFPCTLDPLPVMAGLVPAIHAEALLHSASLSEGDVDARVKRGHDGAFLLFSQNREALIMSNDDWKKSLPFPRHWLSYIGFKLLILVVAIILAWQILRAFEVL